MSEPTGLHLLPADSFPFAITIISRNGSVVWEQTIERPEQLVAITIPGFAGTEHYPVRVVIQYANGTSSMA